MNNFGHIIAFLVGMFLKRIPADIYLFNYNKGNKAKSKICSKLTIKTPERCQWRLSGVFIVNFEQISHFVMVFP